MGKLVLIRDEHSRIEFLGNCITIVHNDKSHDMEFSASSRKVAGEDEYKVIMYEFDKNHNEDKKGLDYIRITHFDTNNELSVEGLDVVGNMVVTFSMCCYSEWKEVLSYLDRIVETKTLELGDPIEEIYRKKVYDVLEFPLCEFDERRGMFVIRVKGYNGTDKLFERDFGVFRIKHEWYPHGDKYIFKSTHRGPRFITMNYNEDSMFLNLFIGCKCSTFRLKRDNYEKTAERLGEMKRFTDNFVESRTDLKNNHKFII